MANGWTLERRARQATLSRKWQPWEQSTGPKASKGKAEASRKAYKGGTWLVLQKVVRAMREQRKVLTRL
jgi:hypothetical protein